jgi:hypothetical protein
VPAARLAVDEAELDGLGVGGDHGDVHPAVTRADAQRVGSGGFAGHPGSLPHNAVIVRWHRVTEP